MENFASQHPWLSAAFTYLGPLALGGVGSLLVFIFGLPTSLGQKILQYSFEKRTETFKAFLAKEGELYKNELKAKSDAALGETKSALKKGNDDYVERLKYGIDSCN
jgi:hypothetical protein